MSVKYDVVGPAQRASKVAGSVYQLNFAGFDIDSFNPSTGVVAGDPMGDKQPIHLSPAEAAVVYAVELAVRSQGKPVRAAAYLGDGLLATIRVNPGDAGGLDFNNHYATIGQRNGTFGKTQPFCHYLHGAFILAAILTLRGLVPTQSAFDLGR